MPTPLTVAIGQNIRFYRREKHLSQQKLGDLSGLGVMQISKLERGVTNPKLETLQAVADALHVTFEELTKTGKLT